MVILRFPIRRIDSIGIPLISLISHLVVGFMRLPIRPLALVILLTLFGCVSAIATPNKTETYQAAEQGQADAQYRLGLMYEDHLGVPQDYQQAYAWLSIAVANGMSEAVKRRDTMAKLLTPSALNEAQALSRQYVKQFHLE